MKKYLSRKFILTILGVISGVATALTGVGGSLGLVAGITVTGLSTITYIITEGKIDKASITMTVNSVEQIITLIEQAKDKKES